MAQDQTGPELAAVWPDRRSFLRSTAGGAAAVAFASLLPAGCSPDYPQAARDAAKLESLTEKEYAITLATAEALLDGLPVPAYVVVARIDRELAAVGDPVREDFKTVLALVEHLTVLGGQRRRFTRLEPAARLAYLRGWATSRFALRRAAYFALKGFVQYFAFIEPTTRAVTGYTGPWTERATVAPRPVDFGATA